MYTYWKDIVDEPSMRGNAPAVVSPKIVSTGETHISWLRLPHACSKGQAARALYITRCASLWLIQSPQNNSLIPIGSMYAIYGNIYHQYTPNVSIYTIHGSYGVGNTMDQYKSLGQLLSPMKSSRTQWCRAANDAIGYQYSNPNKQKEGINGINLPYYAYEFSRM